jgi:hypothetical protein
MNSPDDLIPDGDVAEQRYHVHIKTLARWDNDPRLDFPPPIVINNRKYRRRRDLEDFERRHVVRRAGRQAAVADASTEVV